MRVLRAGTDGTELCDFISSTRPIVYAFRFTFIGALLVLGAGCGASEGADDAEAPAPSPATSPAPSAASAHSVGEGTTAPAPAPVNAEEQTPAATAPVDLLHAVSAAVTVSSATNQDEAQVAKLFDGNPETAWNGETGDLDDAWIAIAVPEDVTVVALEMIPGYAKTTRRHDLFTGNQRIRRVAIERGGEMIAEHTFDLESREAQSIALDGAGGVFQIRLLEFTAGTEAEWREPCVSEVRLMGHAESAAAEPRDPIVGIGDFPRSPQQAAPTTR